MVVGFLSGCGKAASSAGAETPEAGAETEHEGGVFMTQTSPAAARQLEDIPVHRKSLNQRPQENGQLYVMLLIPVVLTIVYKYAILIGTIFENCDKHETGFLQYLR